MKRDEAREERIKNLYIIDGLSMDDIGVEYNISRQRVQQILRRNGVRGHDYTLALTGAEILAALEANPKLRTHADLSDYLEVSPWTVMKAIRHAPVQLKRRIRAQYDLNRRQHYIDRIREIGERVGHTPTAQELNNHGVHSTRIQYVFGSLRQAQIEAGFRPNPIGRPQTFRQLRTMWRREP